MKNLVVIAIVSLSYFVASSAYAVELLPQPQHRPLYSQQGFSPEARSLRPVETAGFAIPIHGIRAARATPCVNALCPSYIVLGTSY